MYTPEQLIQESSYFTSVGIQYLMDYAITFLQDNPQGTPQEFDLFLDDCFKDIYL